MTERTTRRKRDPRERFWSKVAVDWNDPLAGCWLWAASIQSDGYAVFQIAGPPNPTVSQMVHRFAYEQLVGPVPAGLELDHLCRVRNCVNPAHLEPVTKSENLLRIPRPPSPTHCPQGHPYAGDNLYVNPRNTTSQRPSNACRACSREASRRYEARSMRRGRRRVEP